MVCRRSALITPAQTLIAMTKPSRKTAILLAVVFGLVGLQLVLIGLVVSKVANFAIDLPDANVAVQVSGTFGSRQEEAQRLGRILRPKSDGTLAHFYTIVTRDTNDQEFSAKRQLFLTEQGYRYTILDAAELLDRASRTAGDN